MIHNQIEISLSVPCFLVLETVVSRWEGMQTGREQLDFTGKDRELPSLGLARDTLATNDISATESVVKSNKVLIFTQVFVSHDLDLCALSVDVVEASISLRPDAVDSSRNTLLFFCSLALGETGVLLLKVGKGDSDMELMGVGIGLHVCHRRLAQFNILVGIQIRFALLFSSLAFRLRLRIILCFL
eukprot:Lithocolla_globosa_v1_NODE_350_length_4366_cov_13.568778.p3 type:complete len:186 gc:universal NODE_350_length_4366_cov_13.568778:3471-4028(+)